MPGNKGLLVLQADSSKSPKVVPHADVPPSSIIMMGFSTAKITNLPAFYCCAKVKLQTSYANDEASSLRWQGCIKGLPGGFFNPKSAMFEIYFNGKHKHTKVSHNSYKISLCGTKSEAEGEAITRRAIDYVVDAQNYLKSTRTPAFQKAMDWLLSETRGLKRRHTKYITVRKKEFGTIEVCKDISDYLLVWPRPEDYPPRYAKILQEFLERSDDLVQNTASLFYSDLVNRISAIANFTDIYRKKYAFKEIKLSSYIYFYDLGFLPDREKLDSYLTNNGYDSDYDPIWSHYITVFMTTLTGLNVSKLHRKDISGKQTFIFYPKGKVRHNGPNKEAMAICYEKIMSTIAAAKPFLVI